MPARHIALVPEFGMNPSELARVSAALQKQVTRDLEPVWQVTATVDAFPTLEDVPAGYWPIVLTFRALGSDAGIHVDRNGQPFALVELSASWSLTASHVCLELVTDPFGSRTFPGPSPRSEQGDVEFLGAICDPCESAEFAYLINDVLVSDFCTPSYWDPAASPKERRSFTGAIQEAYQVLPGGHLSWYDPATNRWWLRRAVAAGSSDLEVGTADPDGGSVREFMGRHSSHLLGTKMTVDAYEARVGMRRQRALRASQSRAFWLRSAFGSVRPEDALGVGAEMRSLGAHASHASRGSVAAAVANAAAIDAEGDETTITIEPSALEQEVAAALERVEGEIRASSPPPPVEPVPGPYVSAAVAHAGVDEGGARYAVPPGYAMAPHDAEARDADAGWPGGRTMPPPLPGVPGASGPPPETSIPPAEVPLRRATPSVMPSISPPPKHASQGWVFVGGVAAALAIVGGMTAFRSNDPRPAAAAGGAALSAAGAPAVGAGPVPAAAPVESGHGAPVVSSVATAPNQAPLQSAPPPSAAHATQIHDVAAPAREVIGTVAEPVPAAVRPAAAARALTPAPVQHPAGEPVAGRTRAGAPMADTTRPAPAVEVAPAPVARTAAPIDTLIDDRR